VQVDRNDGIAGSVLLIDDEGAFFDRRNERVEPRPIRDYHGRRLPTAIGLSLPHATSEFPIIRFGGERVAGLRRDRVRSGCVALELDDFQCGFRDAGCRSPKPVSRLPLSRTSQFS
jgi:hypothetical protein